MDHANPSAQLTHGEKSLDLPMVPAVEGNSGISIAPLRKETGEVTYNPGFMNTANAKSAITFIDGDEGILRYRGYPIEQLAEKSSFLEVSYLLINGELPTNGQLDNFEAQVERRGRCSTSASSACSTATRATPTRWPCCRPAPPRAVDLLPGLPGSLRRGAGAAVLRTALLAKMPTMAAYAHRIAQGHALLYPDNRLYADRELPAPDLRLPGRGLHRRPGRGARSNGAASRFSHPTTSKCLRASAVRLVGSSRRTCSPRSPPASVGFLGPADAGGANAAVMDMLDQMQAENMDPRDFMEKVKNKEDGIRLMGFGHRVYKTTIRALAS